MLLLRERSRLLPYTCSRIGTNSMVPSMSNSTTPPPRNSGHWSTKCVVQSTQAGRPSRRLSILFSKLENPRPAQPPAAPDHIEPGRNSRHDCASHPA